MSRPAVLSAVLLIFLTSPASMSAAELPSTLKVGQQQLVLNGVGTREKYFLDLYVAGLYLAQPQQQAAAVVNADATMVMRIMITSKLVSQERLVESLEEGFASSTGGNVEPIRGQVQQFRQCFADQITRGDVFDLVYAPGQGTLVFKNGKQKGTVPGIEFKRALFGIWLSDRPADAQLKQALLQGPSAVRKR